MPYVRTLRDYRPIPREDDLPWTIARVEEAAAADGPWTALESFPLSPVDADPDAPASRDFTTDQAQLATGWYRIVWLDAGGGISESAARRYGAPGTLPPSVADVRARSALLRSRYPENPYNAEKELELEVALVDAVALVEELTCRTIDETLTDERLVNLAFRAVTLKTEALALSGGAQARASAVSRAGSGGLRSISAGPWSESYFGPEEAAKAQRLDPDAALHEALWALATEECREAWLVRWTNVVQPSSASDAFNFRRGGGY